MLGAAGERRAGNRAGVDHGAEDDDGIGRARLVLKAVGVEQAEGEWEEEDGSEEKTDEQVCECVGV
jgi:hypothetical protein